MATASKTWTWNSDLESWVASQLGDGNAQRDASNGDPNAGSLQMYLTPGRTQDGSGSFTLNTISWATLFGISSSATVTHVQVLSGTRTYAGLTHWVPSATPNWAMTVYVMDSTYQILFQRSGTTQDSSWNSGSAGSNRALSTPQSASSNADFLVYLNASTGNTASSTISCHLDYLTIQVTYESIKQGTSSPVACAVASAAGSRTRARTVEAVCAVEATATGTKPSGSTKDGTANVACCAVAAESRIRVRERTASIVCCAVTSAGSTKPATANIVACVDATGEGPSLDKLDIEVPIEMLAYGVQWPTTSTVVDWLISETWLDPADYDGTCEYFFEVLTDDCPSGAEIKLYDATADAVMATATLAISKTEGRTRSAAFTPNSGNHKYLLRTPSAVQAGKVFGARIIVRQTGATKTRVPILISGMLSTTVTTTNSVGNGVVDYATDAANSLCGYAARWLYTAADWDAVSDVTFEALGSATNLACTQANLIFRTAAGSAISTLSYDEDDPLAIAYKNESGLSLSDATTYSLGVQGDGTYGIQLYKAYITLTLDVASKAEVYWLVERNQSYSADYCFASTRALIEKARYSGTPAVYLETTASCVGTGNLMLADLGFFDAYTSYFPNYWETIAGSSITVSGSSSARYRSSDCALAFYSGHNFALNADFQSATINTRLNYLVVTAQAVVPLAATTKIGYVHAPAPVAGTASRSYIVASIGAGIAAVVKTAAGARAAPDLVSYLQLSSKGTSETGTDVLFHRSSVWLDPSDYDNATFYFEVAASNTSTTEDAVITLYDETADSDAVSVSIPQDLGTSIQRVRSTAFVPATGDHLYAVEVSGLSSGVSCAWSARIVIVQSGATKTRMQIPLNAGTSSSGSTDEPGYTSSSGSASWATVTTVSHRWRYSAAAWEGVSELEFDALLTHSTGAGTAYVCLYDVTAGSAVTATILSTTATTLDNGPLRATFATSDLVDGHLYALAIRRDTIGSAYLYATRLTFVLSSASNLKGEAWYIVGDMGGNTSGVLTLNDYRLKYDWDAISEPTPHLEAYTSGDLALHFRGGPVYELHDGGTSDSSDTTTAVPGAGFSPALSVNTLVRGDEFAPPTAGNRLIIKKRDTTPANATTNQVYLVTSWAPKLIAGAHRVGNGNASPVVAVEATATGTREEGEGATKQGSADVTFVAVASAGSVKPARVEAVGALEATEAHLRLRARTADAVACVEATATGTKERGGTTKQGTADVFVVAVASEAHLRTRARTATVVGVVVANAGSVKPARSSIVVCAVTSETRIRVRARTASVVGVALATAGSTKPARSTPVVATVATAAGQRIRSRTASLVACAVASAYAAEIEANTAAIVVATVATANGTRVRLATSAPVAVAVASAASVKPARSSIVACAEATATGSKGGYKYATAEVAAVVVATAASVKPARSSLVCATVASADGLKTAQRTATAVCCAAATAAGKNICAVTFTEPHDDDRYEYGTGGQIAWTCTPVENVTFHLYAVYRGTAVEYWLKDVAADGSGSYSTADDFNVPPGQYRMTVVVT